MFSVPSTEDMRVEELWTLFHATAPDFASVPHHLRLYLGKADGLWLNEKDMDASIVPDEEYSLSLSTTKTLTEVGIADEDAQQTRGVVDVLIVPPPRSEEILTEADFNAILIREVFIDSSSEASAPSSEFQTKLRTTYQCNEVVIGSHLLHQKHRRLAPILFDIDDIDDVQNGLLLFEPLKRAYDAFQLSFLYDKDSDQFYLKLFDPSLRKSVY
ncbi:hypothetical protein Poli38472_001379 [Pythium oligandrum]|uniref:HNH nuclease domain-containing protein n=1 Tax=Pythium oligandrum TaxID=41045 RepID=A0A8K1FT49_PYTOL|nr:hypothetical protein Poli38472_001379 [Pythium oligandrum]|eukprot:TMW69223.1 hypothetical protein Poli38472_001379 [Pythium oligandrum]